MHKMICPIFPLFLANGTMGRFRKDAIIEIYPTVKVSAGKMQEYHVQITICVRKDHKCLVFHG